jgi:hypothetical protein
MARNINAVRIKTYAGAKDVIEGYIRQRNMDDTVWTWLVVDEDYEDGCIFTRAQLMREVESAWKLELSARKMHSVIEFVGRRHGLSDYAIRDITRTVALNM